MVEWRQLPCAVLHHAVHAHTVHSQQRTAERHRRTGFCKPAIPGNCFFSNCSSTHTWSSVSKLNSSKTKSTRCCFDEHTTLAFLMCGRLVGTGSSEAVIAGQAVVERSAAAGRVVVVTIAAGWTVVVVTIAVAGRVVVVTIAAARGRW